VQAGVLDEQQREIVILRTGHHWRSAYEWAHHVWRGRRVGLSGARIERARAAPESWTGNDADEILLRAVDRLLTNGTLDRQALAELRGVLSDVAITDLMATIGFYTTLAFLLRSFETPVDAFVLEEPGL
jgi:alkylhydroperoxidase family enzyme